MKTFSKVRLIVGMGAALLCTAAVLELAPPAQAQQMGKAPYKPGVSRDGSFGMSPAYREAIMRQEIFGETPDNIMRGSGGVLLQVERRNGQAFLTRPQPVFVARRSRLALGTPLFGGGFGPTGGGFGASYAGTAIGGGNPAIWLSMVETTGMPWSAVSGSGSGSSPINVWIAQLEAFPD